MHKGCIDGNISDAAYFTPKMSPNEANEKFRNIKKGNVFQASREGVGNGIKFSKDTIKDSGKFMIREIAEQGNKVPKKFVKKTSTDTYGDSGGEGLVTVVEEAEKSIAQRAKKKYVKIRKEEKIAVNYSKRVIEAEYKKALKSGDFRRFEKVMQVGDDKFSLSKVVEKEGPVDSHEAYKAFQKKAMQKKFSRRIYQENQRRAAVRVQQKTGEVVNDVATKCKDAVMKLLSKPEVLIIAACILGVFIIIEVGITLIGSMSGIGETSGLATTYIAEDSEIYACENYYLQREDQVKEWVNKIEINYPGYDEYDYSDVASMFHNPYVVSSYLNSLLHQPFRASEITGYIDVFFETQYQWYTTEEILEREEPILDEYGDQIDTQIIQYRILHVHVKNNGEVKTAYKLLPADAAQAFSVQVSVKGHKAYLWDGYNIDDTSTVNRGQKNKYQVPKNLINDDPAFGRLVEVGDSLMGTPYVWGGTTPDGFDCSGFVYYVYNTSGYASMPRLTAQGIYDNCDLVSGDEVMPGDLIFLTGTMASSNNVTHVAIYVGNNTVMNCGNPVKYCNITTGWWKNHFYAYGRFRR